MLNTLKNLISPTSPAVYFQNYKQAITTLPTNTIIFDTTKHTATKSADSTLTTENQLKSIKLIMLTAINNNKCYEMQENAKENFTVIYDRIGINGATRTYPIQHWDKSINKKGVSRFW